MGPPVRFVKMHVTRYFGFAVAFSFPGETAKSAPNPLQMVKLASVAFGFAGCPDGTLSKTIWCCVCFGRNRAPHLVEITRR